MLPGSREMPSQAMSEQVPLVRSIQGPWRAKAHSPTDEINSAKMAIRTERTDLEGVIFHLLLQFVCISSIFQASKRHSIYASADALNDEYFLSLL